MSFDNQYFYCQGAVIEIDDNMNLRELTIDEQKDFYVELARRLGLLKEEEDEQ